MKLEIYRMLMLLTLPSVIMIAIPDYFGVVNIKTEFAVFRYWFGVITTLIFVYSLCFYVSGKLILNKKGD